MSTSPIPSLRTVLIWRAGVAVGVRLAGAALIVAGIAWFMGALSTSFIVAPIMTQQWPTWSRRYAATGGGNVTIESLGAYNRAAGRSFGLGLTGLGLIVCARTIARVTVPLRPLRPKCPMCGYPTTELATLRCPECGVHLPGELIAAPATAAPAVDRPAPPGTAATPS